MLSLVTSTPQDSSLLRFPHRTTPPHRSRIFGEWWLIIPVGTAVLFFLHGHEWLSDLSNPLRLSAMLGWLLLVIVLSAFAVLRHAEHLAARLGEPLGTVILTLSVTGIEVMMIAAFMYTGNGNASLARDAMFAVVMLVLNGMVGLSLLLGGLRYHEQTYNLQGANAFLAVIMPLAALGLVMPNYTVSSSGPTFSPHQSVFLIIMSLGLYGVFLAIQNLRHRDYFVAPRSSKNATRRSCTNTTLSRRLGLVPYPTPLSLPTPAGHSVGACCRPDRSHASTLARPSHPGRGVGRGTRAGAGIPWRSSRGPSQSIAALRQHTFGFGPRQH